MLKGKPEFQVRYIDYPVPARLMIKDNKEVFISPTAKEVNPLEYPCLWSNNPVIVQVIQQWYDMVWEKAVRNEKQ